MIRASKSSCAASNAICDKDIERVRSLLEKGVDPNVPDVPFTIDSIIICMIQLAIFRFTLLLELLRASFGELLLDCLKCSFGGKKLACLMFYVMG